MNRFPSPFPPCFADAWGDDRHGLWSALTLETAHGRARQLMRWIEPGRFLMGSPEGEEGRGNEYPQHEVSLTRGYWLAETACTQALWQAVMGENPSKFKGEDLPVEHVSWEDVQVFLQRLQGLLPGSEASLPTEAEWEYACRAGTPTAYYFGDEVDREKANYGGFQQLSEATVAVKSFAPNAWGLYQMHGNVLEWCADGLRPYDGEAQANPLGRGRPPPNAVRAIRGGSWLSRPERLHSASRNACDIGHRDDIVGFRFALRSIEPGQGRPGGPAPG